MKNLSRQQFLKTMGLGGLLIGTGQLSAMSALQEKPKLDTKLVQEFVGASHGKMDKVKKLFAEHPTLINAANDWGNGDFETGLGAASHVGYKELAKWFIDQGAQANIFTAVLFGRMDIVKPILDFFPETVHAVGPHGFTLLHHANKGGEEAAEVKAYLEGLGAKETKMAIYG